MAARLQPNCGLPGFSRTLYCAQSVPSVSATNYARIGGPWGRCERCIPRVSHDTHIRHGWDAFGDDGEDDDEAGDLLSFMDDLAAARQAPLTAEGPLRPERVSHVTGEPSSAPVGMQQRPQPVHPGRPPSKKPPPPAAVFSDSDSLIEVRVHACMHGNAYMAHHVCAADMCACLHKRVCAGECAQRYRATPAMPCKPPVMSVTSA